MVTSRSRSLLRVYPIYVINYCKTLPSRIGQEQACTRITLQTKAILFKMISLSLALAIPPISSLDLLPANRLAQLMVPCTTVIETILNFPVLNFVRGSRKSKGLRGAGDEKDH